MCPLLDGDANHTANLIVFVGKVFFLAWVVFVPIMILSRLDKLIKILEKKK